MNRPEAAIAITNEFISNFNETTAVSFDNQLNFWFCTSPLTSTTKPSNSVWVNFGTIDNSTPTITIGEIGHRRFRRSGFIFTQVYIPEGTGTSDGLDICEEINNIFEGKRISTDIVFTEGEIVPVGIIESGWYKYNITVYYTFFETK